MGVEYGPIRATLLCAGWRVTIKYQALQCGEPYHWIPAAVAKLVKLRKTSPAQAQRELLRSGALRGPDDLWARKIPRGGSARAQLLPMAVVDDDLGARIQQIREQMKKPHVARAAAAAAALAQGAASAEHSEAWRLPDGILFRLCGDKLDRSAVDLVTSYVTHDIGTTDVLRALYARELELLGLAPKGWQDHKTVVHRGLVRLLRE